MSNSDNDPTGEEETPSTEEFEGLPTFPAGTSNVHRRRLLKAMAGGSTVAVAGCLGNGDEDGEDDGDEDDGGDDGEEEPEPASFELSNLDPEEATVEVGETITVSADVANTGEEAGTATVNLAIDGASLASQDVEVEPDATETVEFSAGTDGFNTREYAHSLSLDDQELSGTFTLESSYWAADTQTAYAEQETMRPDVRPDTLVKDINVQVAFNDEEIIFRFHWDQPNEGGWLHDMLVYNGVEWVNHQNWDPWNLDEEGAPEGAMQHHQGMYEDRLSFMWDDGTVDGFENFGGWMTVMEGVRRLPGEAASDEVTDHPFFGEDGESANSSGKSDMRKYIPQSRNGEWWEHDWDDPKSQEELDQMLEDGEYLDFPMWRAHRSNPVGFGTNHYVLEYRNGQVEGSNTYGSQSWDPEAGPEYMFDPDIVENGAMDYNEIITDDNEPGPGIPDQQDYEQYALLDGENVVDFDPEVAEFEGAMIPRRVLSEPTEGGRSWRAEGVWEDGTWTVEMRRDLETEYVDDMDVEEGEVYTWSPAIHHGSSQRWHWVAYPYKLGLGVEPEYYGETEHGATELVAENVEDEPDWEDVQTYTIPLMYPGMVDWTWLTNGEHPRVDEVRDAEITIWEHHDENPEDFAQRMIDLEELMAARK
ncbi:ethylbenzene dehydrogenase-related protein [Halovenus amylolytica]|uniref:ethylbenzene dehydrogenase-related protein n=1 Tax=Halovenus amylolytica TaxID=2500550 RepID=UPI00361F00A5